MIGIPYIMSLLWLFCGARVLLKSKFKLSSMVVCSVGFGFILLWWGVQISIEIKLM